MPINNKKPASADAGFSVISKLSLEISFGDSFLSGSFFLSSGLFASALTLFSGSLFLSSLFALAALAVFFTGAFAVFAALALFIAAAATQELLCPGNDCVTVGGNQIDSAGDGSNSGQDLTNDSSNFHYFFLQLFLI
jgi:hypothetical protein